MRFSQVAFSVTLVAAVSAGPISGDYHQRRAAAASFALKNGQDAQALNQKFQSLSTSSSCNSGEQACVQGQLAQCVDGKFVMTPCASTLQCVALPLVNKPGTRYVPRTTPHETGMEFHRFRLTIRHSITCDTQQDAEARIANTGATGGLVGKREIVVRYVSLAFRPHRDRAHAHVDPSVFRLKKVQIRHLQQHVKPSRSVQNPPALAESTPCSSESLRPT